jgi:crossover junction endodeoxyribonuclease RuvC
VATGYAVLARASAEPAVVATGLIATSVELAFEARLRLIYDGLHDLLVKHAPDIVVLEDLYAEYEFPRTALLMAHARGVVCLAAAQCGVPVLALAPAEVKRAVAFNGAASKAQVQRAIGRLLDLPEPPHPSHVADALALAWTGLSRAGRPSGRATGPAPALSHPEIGGPSGRATPGPAPALSDPEIGGPSGRATPGPAPALSDPETGGPSGRATPGPAPALADPEIGGPSGRAKPGSPRVQ